MSYSAYTSVIAGSILTAAFWNQQIKDNGLYHHDFATNVLNGISLFAFGGTALEPVAGTSFPSGATYDKLAPSTGVWHIDSSNAPGTLVLEAVLAASGGATVSLELVNLTDAPDTAIVTITATSATGARVLSSTITLAAGGSAKDYGVKLKIGTAGERGFAWGIRITRTA